MEVRKAISMVRPSVPMTARYATAKTAGKTAGWMGDNSHGRCGLEGRTAGCLKSLKCTGIRVERSIESCLVRRTRKRNKSPVDVMPNCSSGRRRRPGKRTRQMGMYCTARRRLQRLFPACIAYSSMRPSSSKSPHRRGSRRQRRRPNMNPLDTKYKWKTPLPKTCRPDRRRTTPKDR